MSYRVRRELAIDTADGKEAYAVRQALAKWTARNRSVGAGATLQETTGYWDGGSANGLLIRFDWPPGQQGRVLWEELVEEVSVATEFQTLGHETTTTVQFAERNLERKSEKGATAAASGNTNESLKLTRLRLYRAQAEVRYYQAKLTGRAGDKLAEHEFAYMTSLAAEIDSFTALLEAERN